MMFIEAIVVIELNQQRSKTSILLLTQLRHDPGAPPWPRQASSYQKCNSCNLHLPV